MITKKYLVEYYSNNSGGNWWLTDEDWYALERAGWDVKWVKNMDDGALFGREAKKTGRWLGALAKEATIVVEAYSKSFAEDIAETWWSETLPNQNRYDEGCNCCGRPHEFYAEEYNED